MRCWFRTVVLFAAVGSAGGCDIGGEVSVDAGLPSRSLEEIRAELLVHLWGEPRLPTLAVPTLLELGISDPWIPGVENAASVDRITWPNDYSDKPVFSHSVANHFHPKQGGQRLILYNEGHCSPFCASSPRAISFFLEHGFSVLAYAMPLYGPNEDPTWESIARRHSLLEELEGGNLSVLRLFFEQLAFGLNYVQSNFDYIDISMIGYSGGGWTSTIYPALDTRVGISFPIAGTLPRHLLPADIDEYEQSVERAIYEVASFVDFYSLASSGPGRRHIHTLNIDDPCCFAARGLEPQLEENRKEVQLLVDEGGLGGQYLVHVVTDHNGHEISQAALDMALAVLSE